MSATVEEDKRVAEMDPQMRRLTRYGREPSQIVATYKVQVKQFEADYQLHLEKEK